MTFKHKLSVRLALLKDALLLLPLTALLACEKPAGISGPGPVAVVTRVAISPPQITLRPNQTSHFTAVGLTAAGDTASVPVTWTATGGSIVDTFSRGSLHYATYQPSAVPGNYFVIATDPPETAVADSSSVVVIALPVASVVLSPTVATLLVGATVQFTATPQDSSGLPLAGRAVTWTSSAPAVATVTANGVVTGVASGSATITATSEGKSGSAATTVTAIPVASLAVSPASASLLVGATAQLTATPKDLAGSPLSGRVVAWASSNTAVASVSASGLVTAAAAGSASITATSEGKSAAAAITVTPPPPPPPPSGLPVFPGAEGYGTTTPGGRGGRVIHVTNLNDAGPGSLREALEAAGPRTVVFDVSGQINLQNSLNIHNGFLTLAGQTAPSPGITVAVTGGPGVLNNGIVTFTNDILIQHIRIRAQTDPSGGRRDVLMIFEGSRNVVIDHVSVSWASHLGKNISVSGGTTNVTISNCIDSEAFPYGLLITASGASGPARSMNTAVFRCLFAHNQDRNPEVSSNTSVTYVNQLIYNPGFTIAGSHSFGFSLWRGQANGTLPDGPAFANIVGNKAKAGPTSGPLRLRFESSALPNSLVYTADDIFPDGLEFQTGTGYSPVPSPAFPLPSPFTILGSNVVEAYVLAHAGARPLDRDAVDTRIVNDVTSLTGSSILTDESQVGGLPPLAQNVRVLTIPANYADLRPSGYTVLEEDVLFPLARALEP